MNGLLIGRVRGIEVRVNWSVAIIAALIASSLATQAFPEMAEGHSDGAYWVAGVTATIGFLAAIVAHELGHSFVALSHGVGVRSITLWMLGGVARLDNSPESPSAGIQIAIAGPAVSLACGILGLAAAAMSAGLVGAVMLWFGFVNLLLAGFNLLPAFPLDGGRVYQAWLWRGGLSQEEATVKAAARGGSIGRAMVWLGVVEILFFGLLWGGLWMMAIGWFLREASLAEAQGVRTQGTLRRFTTAEVMTSGPATVLASRSVDRLVEEVLVGGRHAAYPVVDDDGGVVGLVELKAVRAVPRDVWTTTTVAGIMKPLTEVPVVSPWDGADQLVRLMQEHADTRALVMDGGELVGIVAPSDIVRLTIAVELAQGTDQGPRGAIKSI